MNTFLNIVQGLCAFLIILFEIFHEEKSFKRSTRITVVLIIVAIGIAATIKKDAMAEHEQKSNSSVFLKELYKWDSVNRVESDARQQNLTRQFTEAIKQYGLQINKLLPPLTDLKVSSTNEGLLIQYQISHPIEELKFVLMANPFDKTFNSTFGDRIQVDLPKKMGSNSFLVKLKEIELGNTIQFILRGENPYLSTPVIEYKHGRAMSRDKIKVESDNFTITTEDGKPITTEDGKVLKKD